jgi:tripeptide aminopeptidase
MEESVINRVLELAIKVQQIPAPTFSEGQRARFIQQNFLDQGISDVTVDTVGNVYAHLVGRGEALPLIISAHLDTVFPSRTDLLLTRSSDRLSGPGIGDNSLGLAALFGLFWELNDAGIDQLARLPLPGDLWLVANVCEEGLGNLRGMRAIVDRFGNNILAYLILEGMSLRHVFHRGLGVRRYHITVRTPGGHSWLDYGQPSAIHELAELVVKIKNLPLPVETRCSLNVGVISGGTSVNTIAAEASLQLDIRSESSQTLDMLIAQVEQAVGDAAQEGGDKVKVSAEVIGERPAGELPVEHPLVKLAVKCLDAQGITANLNIGSTDANEPLSRGLPAICVGITTGGGAHTLGEYIDIGPVGQGLAYLVDLIYAIFQERWK